MEIKTTPMDGIRYVQYKLFDFSDGGPKPVNEVLYERLAQNPVRTTIPQIELRDENHFEAVNPVCPECGSKRVIKQDWRRRTLKLSEFKTITIYYKRYKCVECGKKFPTQMDGIVKKGRQYSEFFREKANALAGIVKYSARTTQRALLSLFGISPSHQTIQNWLEAEIPDIERSGYYCYDEQHIKLDGKKAFRLTLYDSVVNVPVAEDVLLKLTDKSVLTFLRENLQGDVHAITTDDRKMYRPIVKKFKASHQLCVFHFLKSLRKEASWYFNRKSIPKSERMQWAVCVSSIHEVFRSSSLEEAEEKFGKVVEMMDFVPRGIRKYIKRLIRDFHLYTAYFTDPNIAKTTNQVEEYYRQTDPKKIKKRYKTPQGLIQALNQKAVVWVVRHGYISKKTSLYYARRFLGKSYNNTSINSFFSKRKKHVLTYWIGDPTRESISI